MTKSLWAGAVTCIAALLLALWEAPAAHGGRPPQSAKTKSRAASDLGAKVVATVNGEKITRAQVVDQMLSEQTARLTATNSQFADRQRATAGVVGALVLKRMATSGGRPVTISRADLLDWIFQDNPPVLAETVQNIIRERAIAHAAKKQGIKLTESEIKSQITQSIARARQQFSPILAGKSDTQVLAAFGLRPETLRRGVITSILAEKLVQKDLEKQMGHAIGPDDYLDVSHILVRVAANAQDSASTEKAFEEAKTKILGYAEEINSGKITFEKAALERSDDSSKFQNGRLPVFVRGQMVPEFEKAAFSQEPGKLGEPVRSPYGWHLIRVNRLGKDIPAAERETALQNLLRGRVPQYVSQVVQEAKVTNTVMMPQTGPMILPGNRPPGPGRPPVPRPGGGPPNP